MSKQLPPGLRPSDITTAEQAIAELRGMQKQIIHGTNLFGDIADIIMELAGEVKSLRQHEFMANRLYTDLRNRTIPEPNGTGMIDEVRAIMLQRKHLIEENERLTELLASVPIRDGKWMDKWGACKVCDGEIPNGHTNDCDIWKLEQQVRTLKMERADLKFQRDALLEMTWLDLPAEPHESTAKWKAEFEKGWVRK